ncbi:hypothetical protein ACHHYP_00646 [Achlya hypogyna]|uniref:Homeobox domain-containing protein n=1 Tax=Achlya hypogyna TaxID=1202772 RepID=A0A1V9ZAI4_ACHHY|nr:hypothetical protein ACHHYP_00646 [Achlya hypogyna]
MTLPNHPAYAPVAFGGTPAPAPVAPEAVVAIVREHPLFVLVQRVLDMLDMPAEATLPSKRELAKLIAQAQAPAFAAVTPTLLVLLTLNLRVLQYMRGAMAPPFGGGLPRRLSVESNKSDDDGDDDHKPKRSRLTRRSNEIMTAWFLAHKGNPYPSGAERLAIANKTQLSELQVRNWFANMRKRHWKPSNSEKKPRCLLDLVLRRSTV